MKLAISAWVVQTWATSMAALLRASAISALHGASDSVSSVLMSIPYTSLQAGSAERVVRAARCQAPDEVPATLGQIAHRREVELVGRLLANRESVGIGPRREVEDRLAERLECRGDVGLGRIRVGGGHELEEPGKAAKVVGIQVDVAAVDGGSHGSRSPSSRLRSTVKPCASRACA